MHLRAVSSHCCRGATMAVAVLGLFLLGCTEAVAPDETTGVLGTYSLQTINGHPLPVDPWAPEKEALFENWLITLGEDAHGQPGTFVSTMRVQWEDDGDYVAASEHEDSGSFNMSDNTITLSPAPELIDVPSNEVVMTLQGTTLRAEIYGWTWVFEKQ